MQLPLVCSQFSVHGPLVQGCTVKSCIQAAAYMNRGMVSVPNEGRPTTYKLGLNISMLVLRVNNYCQIFTIFLIYSYKLALNMTNEVFFKYTKMYSKYLG